MRLKKTLVLVGLFASCSVSAFAAPVKYSFWTLRQHPEVVGGFIPTWTGMGLSFTPISLIADRKTELKLLIGGGYTQRKAWYDPNTGLMLDDQDRNPLVFDVEEYDWRAQLSQGFWASWVPDKDLVTLYVGYDGMFTRTHDSMVEGERRENGSSSSKQEVLSIDDWFAQSLYSGASPKHNPYYPDMGDTLAATLYGGVKLDAMRDTISTQDGFSTEVNVRYMPGPLNDSMDGRADCYSVTSNTVFAKTLCSVKDVKGRNLFSAVALDRFNVNWTSGDIIPLSLQESTALGRKVRGFSYWSYDTELSLVNNAEIRLCGPEALIKGVMPRFNFFYDVGFGCGNYYNTNVSDTNFLSSTGVQATITLYDFFDLGLQYAYLFHGHDYTHYDDSVTMRVTFFLDF